MADEDNQPDSQLPEAPPDEQTVVMKHRIRRLSWSVVSDAVLGAFNAEKGFWFTMHGFVVNPSEAFKNYLGEDRLRYSNPIKMVIFLSAVTTFVMHQLQAFDYVQIEGVEDLTPEAKATAEFVKRNYNLLILAGLPVSALITRLFYWGRIYNFLEHVALNAIQISVITLAYFAMLPAIIFWPTSNFVYMVLALAYQVWLYRRVLGPGWFRAIMATVVVTFVYYGLIFSLGARLSGLF